MHPETERSLDSGRGETFSAEAGDDAPRWTPGPWSVGTHLTDPFYITSGDGIVASALVGYAAGRTAATANARLIAAAPDLYKACADWIEWLSPGAPWRDNAADHEERMLDAMSTALAKARGVA